jgi:hypothetical protein
MTDQCERYNIPTNKWYPFDPLRGARAEATVCIVQHQMFIIGGRFHDPTLHHTCVSSSVDTIQMMPLSYSGDLISVSGWCPCPELELPLSLSGHCAATFDENNIIIIGGHDKGLAGVTHTLSWTIDVIKCRMAAYFHAPQQYTWVPTKTMLPLDSIGMMYTII